MCDETTKWLSKENMYTIHYWYEAINKTKADFKKRCMLLHLRILNFYINEMKFYKM